MADTEFPNKTKRNDLVWVGSGPNHLLSTKGPGLEWKILKGQKTKTTVFQLKRHFSNYRGFKLGQTITFIDCGLDSKDLAQLDCISQMRKIGALSFFIFFFFYNKYLTSMKCQMLHGSCHFHEGIITVLGKFSLSKIY